MDKDGDESMRDQGDHISDIDNSQFSTTGNRMKRSSGIIIPVLDVRLYSVDGIEERSSGNADNQMADLMDVDRVEDNNKDNQMDGLMDMDRVKDDNEDEPTGMEIDGE